MGEKLILSAAEVVEAARGWIGTRFHHQGRLKASVAGKGGCDCLGLLVGVAQELALRGRNGQLLAAYDERDYGHIPDGARLKAVLGALLQPVPAEAMRAGDVLLLRFDAEPQHLAIVSAHPYGGAGIIHALAEARAVVEHRLDAVWRDRIIAVYRIPALETRGACG